MSIQRFEVWLVTLNPTQGHDIKKTRPCVVVSPDELSALSTVIVAPMTTKGFAYPCRVSLEFDGKRGLVLLDQLRPVDKTRLVKRLGQVDGKTQQALCDCLAEMFAF